MTHPAHLPADSAGLDDVAMMRRWEQRARGASILDPARLRVPDAHVAAYQDNRWPLDALGNECKEAIVFEHSQRRRKADAMGWRDIEHEWREPLKRLAWLMINKPVPDHLLALPEHTYAARPGTGTIVFTVVKVARFLQWLRASAHVGVTEIRQIDDYHLQQWVKHVHGLHLAQPSSYTRPLTYLWAWGEAGELPASDVLARPFWIGRESAVLTRRTDLGEGREPLPQDTMDPLIWWAVEFVERFSGDCLTALHWYHDNRRRIEPNSTIGHDPDAAVAWLRSLPTHPRIGDGRDLRDMAYLTAISPGLPGRSIWTGLDRLRRHSPASLPPLADEGCAKPLPVEATAQINNQQWIELDWRHVVKNRGRRRSPLLWSVLQGACAVVIGYLGAGPRPLELRTITRGCLNVRHLEGGAVRYLIKGHIKKGRRDEDNQHSLDGVEHLWPVLPQAARAVEVLESLPDPRRSHYLFSDPTGQPLDAHPVNRTIRTFIEFANDLARRHHLPAIAEDPDLVSASRLRRTIGPFIRNRPDGAFGLAVVYGHAGSVIGAAYGGMKQSGSTRFLPRETAEHIATTLNNINTSLDNGGGLSGPAAKEALKSASTFKGAILTSRDWKKVLANAELQVYDNPDRAVGCRFDPTSRPPCQNDAAQDARTEPDLANCHKDCFNRFYTDDHARDHERKAQQLAAWAELAPEPEAIRLRRTAHEHRTAAEQHWATRIGPDGTAMLSDTPSGPNQSMDPSP